MFALQKPSFISTIAAVCLFALTPLVFVLSQSDLYNVSRLLVSYQYWLFVFFYIGIYFLFNKIIVSQFYSTKKWLLFYVSLIALLIITIFVKPFDNLVHFSGKQKHPNEFIKPGNSAPGQQALPSPRENPPPNEIMRKGRSGPAFDIVSVFLLVLVFLIVITDHAVKKSSLTEQRAIQAEADRANAELSFLKAQINPHFLFNTLNNIYSLAITRSEKTADAIMKLSNIMRYVTDGANERMVPLEDETNCITDYIALQKLRLGENFPVEFSVAGNAINKSIPPLCLMTFVENAFKHGISSHEQNSIIFKIQLQDKYIHFFAQNKLFSTVRNAERTGIGIENTKKRLNVLYAEKHLLDIEEKDGFYTVDLILYS
ncbi:MAG: sensor histidine kinase [Bacteroidota bacterium]